MNPELWSGVVGAFMPYMVQALRQWVPDKKWAHFTLAIVVSVLVGSVTSLLAGQFDSENVLNSAATALITSQAIYNYWFKTVKHDELVDKFVAEHT